MASEQERRRVHPIESLLRFACSEEDVLEAPAEDIEAELRASGIEPEHLRERMRHFLNQRRAEDAECETLSIEQSAGRRPDLMATMSVADMRDVIVQYGFAARLDGHLTDADIEALCRQVLELRALEQE